MGIKHIVRSITGFTAKNSPTILTSIAVGGVITTAVMAARGAIMAYEEVLLNHERADLRDEPDPTPKENLAATWHYHIPAVLSGVVTIAAIIGAQRINTRRQAALAAAFTLSEKTLMDYRGKMVEMMGARKEQKVIDSIAHDQIEANPVSKSSVIITGHGDTLCYDSLTGRYFKSDIDRVRKAVNELNNLVLTGGNYFASQNDFYDMLGLPSAVLGEDLGWNAYHLLEMSFSSHLSEDNTPALSLVYNTRPIPQYYKVNPY